MSGLCGTSMRDLALAWWPSQGPGCLLEMVLQSVARRARLTRRDYFGNKCKLMKMPYSWRLTIGMKQFSTYIYIQYICIVVPGTTHLMSLKSMGFL